MSALRKKLSHELLLAQDQDAWMALQVTDKSQTGQIL